MKTIILLLAVLAMVGFASAWETTEQMQYAYQKEVATQAGQHLEWLNGATSTATTQSNTAYGQSNSNVSNTLVYAYAPTFPVCKEYDSTTQQALTDQHNPNTHDTLTQTGGSISTTSAPDLESPAGIKMSGQATTSTDLHLSGNYGACICSNSNTEALFTQHAAVGTDSVNVAANTNPAGTNVGNPNTQTASSDWPHTSETGNGNWQNPYLGQPNENPFSAAVECASMGSYWVEADLGQSTTVGYDQIQAEGASPTMSGSSSAYAGFSGAYRTTNPWNSDTTNNPSIETMVAGSTGFEMSNNWNTANSFTGFPASSAP